jgi:hypothetical protein
MKAPARRMGSGGKYAGLVRCLIPLAPPICYIHDV